MDWRESRPSAAGTATGHERAPFPLALLRPLGVPLLLCLADGLLPGGRYRAALEDTGQEQSDDQIEGGGPPHDGEKATPMHSFDYSSDAATHTLRARVALAASGASAGSPSRAISRLYGTPRRRSIEIGELRNHARAIEALRDALAA